MDIQLMLVKNFSWSLADIDRTDVVSLFDFVRHVASKGEQGTGRQLYAEDVW